MKYLLIMNPGSCSGKSKKLWNLWLRLLNEKKVDFEVVTTNSLEHITQIAKETSGFSVVVAVGGDGTVSRVVDGVLRSSNPACGVGVLYSGTSPDFCKFHKIPTVPIKAIDALLSGRSSYVDVAKLTYYNAGGQTEDAYFTCSCNIGMGAEIARRANFVRRYLGDFLGTACSSIGTIINSKRINLVVEFSGQLVKIDSVNNFSIIINPFLASGMRLNLSKKPNDGRLFLFAIKKRNVLGLFQVLPKFYSGSITAERDIFLTDCQEVKIVSDDVCELEFDGDPRGFLPINVQLCPQKLKLIGCQYA